MDREGRCPIGAAVSLRGPDRPGGQPHGPGLQHRPGARQAPGAQIRARPRGEVAAQGRSGLMTAIPTTAVDDAAREIVLALRWVWGSQRQIERYLVANAADKNYGPPGTGYPPLANIRAIQEELWDAHFMWVAAAQAEKRLRRVARQRRNSQFRLDADLADDIRIMRGLVRALRGAPALIRRRILVQNRSCPSLGREAPWCPPRHRPKRSDWSVARAYRCLRFTG